MPHGRKSVESILPTFVARTVPIATLARFIQTCTDKRALARAKFLDQAGFSQLMLARELSLQEIRVIAGETSAAIEVFSRGVLCVAFSGRRNISRARIRFIPPSNSPWRNGRTVRSASWSPLQSALE